ncbi:MAG: TerB family tellurite resistance protein [Deltaproteobacteria bacterium]|nr:TerB family tellurite resistance protein [Deltaproteobacteria bacterium]
MSELTSNDLKIILLFGIHIARIDGNMDPFEREMLSRFADAMKFSAKDKEELLTRKFSLAEGLRSLSSPDARALLLKTLCSIAYCDGDTHETEVDFISKVVEKMGHAAFILPKAEWGSYEEEVFQTIRSAV